VRFPRRFVARSTPPLTCVVCFVWSWRGRDIVIADLIALMEKERARAEEETSDAGTAISTAEAQQAQYRLKQLQDIVSDSQTARYDHTLRLWPRCVACQLMLCDTAGNPWKPRMRSRASSRLAV